MIIVEIINYLFECSNFYLHISNYTEEVILEYLVQPQGKHYLREKLHHRPPEQVVS